MTDGVSRALAQGLDTETVLLTARALTGEIAGLAGADGSGRNWYAFGESLLRGVSAGLASAGTALAAAIRSVAEEMTDAVQAFSEEHLEMSGNPAAEMRVTLASETVSAPVREAVWTEGAWRGAANPVSQATDSGRTVVQYITLRSNDETPYETARAIRRESEALLHA